MQSLTNFRARLVDNGAFHFSIAVNFNFCPAVFLIAKRETYIFESSGKPSTTDGGRQTVYLLRTIVPLLLPSELITRSFYTLNDANLTRYRRTKAHQVSIPQSIF